MARLVLVALASMAAADFRPNRPITKVVGLLQKMQANLAKEAKEDEAVYEKMDCWCKTNDAEKTKAIKEAEAKISKLENDIAAYSADAERLTGEIANLKKEIDNNEQALDKAYALRREEKASFTAAEKDALQSISALKSAVIVLKKHNSPESLLHVQTVIKGLAYKHGDLLSTPQLHQLTSFAQQDFLDSKPIFKESYAPQSGEIFGILRDMLDTFQANLSQSQKDEQAAQATFMELKAAKDQQIADGKASLMQKKQQLADANSKNAAAREDLEDTQDSLSADQKFLMELKEKCAATDAEWEERQKTRQLELQAVNEAVTVLTTDDARDLSTRTFNPSFMQVGRFSLNEEVASRILLNAARKAKDTSLVQLAGRVGLDAFDKVKAAIDDMIAGLLQEKADEIKHKDFCNSELNSNDKQNTLKTDAKNTLENQIDQLEAGIKTLSEEIKDHEAAIAEMQVQMKRSGENREIENRDFQTTVQDQRDTQVLLAKALDKLKGFYMKKSLLQGPPSPAGFKKFNNQAGAGGVMKLITTIMNDAKVLEAEATQAEKDAQLGYEQFVQNTNDSISRNQQSIVDKTSRRAEKETSKSEKESSLRTTNDELEELKAAASALHTSCDFTLKNFDIRQTGRDEEVEALRQAKSILSGADFQ